MKRSPMPPSGPLRAVSAAQGVRQVIRNSLAAQWKGTRCWIGLEDTCAGVGTHWHELVGRAQGGSTTDHQNLCWSCWPCNSTLERLPDRYERGLKISPSVAMKGEGGLVPRELSPLALASRWL